MSATLKELSERIVRVGEIYAQRFDIERTPDGYLLMLQEELGELTAEHLMMTDRARRPEGDSAEAARERLVNEAADLFGQFILYLNANSIDIESAIERKWLRHLDNWELK